MGEHRGEGNGSMMHTLHHKKLYYFFIVSASKTMYNEFRAIVCTFLRARRCNELDLSGGVGAVLKVFVHIFELSKPIE